MKPRKGFTLVAGKEKMAGSSIWQQFNLELPLGSFLCKMGKYKGIR